MVSPLLPRHRLSQRDYPPHQEPEAAVRPLHTYIHICVYMYVCMLVCMLACMYALRRPCRPIQASSLLLHHRLLVNAVIARVHMHRSTIGRYRRLTEGFSRWRQLHRRLVCLRIVHTPSLAFSFSFLSLSSQPHCIKDLHPHPKRTICRRIIESEVVSSGLELSCF